MNWLLFYCLIFCLSAATTQLLCRYSFKTRLLDIPNHRSSHRMPTPKTGGLAFIFSFMLLCCVLFFLHDIALYILLSFVGCGSLIALIGLMGDYSALSAGW